MSDVSEVSDSAVDPELLPILEQQRARAAARAALQAVPVAEMRRRASAEFAPWNSDPQALPLVRDLDAGGVPSRLYDPQPGCEGGLLVYCHGGGWVIGDLDLEDAALRHVAHRSGLRVLSVDYRLAPEHRFPAALDDVESVCSWIATGPSAIGPAPRRFALGGASAGANLALGAALRLRDAGGPVPDFLVLLYGAYGGGRETASYRDFADGRFGLPRAAMDWFWSAYLGEAGAAHPQGVPLNADLHGLPPVFLSHAELDLLRDDTLLLAERMIAAGLVVDHRAYPGAIHGFTQYLRSSSLARQALDDAADALAAVIG
jgi:acetyl esterase